MADTTLRKTWMDLDNQIRRWWENDIHKAQENEIRTDPKQDLLFLPYPYSTAGGSESMFPEMYCWDTHFINLGLLAHHRYDLVRNHILNHLFMIERFGMVLNGNRTYYLTRSQTPLLAESIRRYDHHQKDRDLLCLAYPLLKKEYLGYWMAEHHQTPIDLATNRDLGDLRHRPELAAEAEVTDFTACFEGDIRNCNSLQTNCALVKYTENLAWIASELEWQDESNHWRTETEKRSDLLRKFCWDEEKGFFFDYQYKENRRLPFWSLCGYWTLYANVATQKQADRLVQNLPKFEHAYGLSQTDTIYPSPHPEFDWVQWGYPAGWPPQHILIVESLNQYGYHNEANRIAKKFLTVLLEQFNQTGKLWEKYNVVEGNLNLPRERYDVPPLHGWSSAAVAVLGRQVFG